LIAGHNEARALGKKIPKKISISMLGNHPPLAKAKQKICIPAKKICTIISERKRSIQSKTQVSFKDMEIGNYGGKAIFLTFGYYNISLSIY